MKNFINSLNFGKTQTFNRLTIQPIFATTDYFLPLLTLEEALELGVLEVREKSEDGSVPELVVINRGDKDVIILEGEELRGAKQNRIVNTTIIVPAGSEIVVPVSCTERGRWRYTSDRFSSGENVLSPSLRKASHGSVTDSLRSQGSYRSDQSLIWSEITLKSVSMGIDSETEAAADILCSAVAPEAEEMLFEEIQHQEKQIGFLAFIGGCFAGGEVLGSAEICKKQMNKLIRGYYLDALDAGVTFPELGSKEIIEQMSSADLEEYAAIGKGTEIRFETSDLQGACKLVDGNVTHLTVLPKDSAQKHGGN